MTDIPRGKPLYNIREFEFTTHFRSRPDWGWGWPRQRLRAPSSCRPHGPRSCQLARYPRTTPPFRRPLRPSCDAVFAPIPTKSGASRASGWILGSWERRRPGPASAASRSLQKTTCHERTCSWSAGRAGELVDQGQRPPAGHSRRHGTDQQFSHPVSSSTRASTSRSAPSRAGREQLRGSSPPFPHGRVHSRTLAMATGRPKNERETETDRDKTHILYKRD